MIGKNFNDLQSILGEPTESYWWDNLDEGDATFEGDNYQIMITYQSDMSVSDFFFSYTVIDATEEDVLEAGNLEDNNLDYSIEIQEWVNPELAKQNGSPEISGIAIYPKN